MGMTWPRVGTEEILPPEYKRRGSGRAKKLRTRKLLISQKKAHFYTN